jgi:hypothetical protein
MVLRSSAFWGLQPTAPPEPLCPVSLIDPDACEVLAEEVPGVMVQPLSFEEVAMMQFHQRSGTV